MELSLDSILSCPSVEPAVRMSRAALSSQTSWDAAMQVSLIHSFLRVNSTILWKGVFMWGAQSWYEPIRDKMKRV